jgi:hypothetical protein
VKPDSGDNDTDPIEDAREPEVQRLVLAAGGLIRCQSGGRGGSDLAAGEHELHLLVGFGNLSSSGEILDRDWCVKSP